MAKIDPNQFLAPGQTATDAFGLETPAGALARVKTRMAQRRADFFASNASASHGRQVGQAFADIFGAPVRRALDTASARSDERARLIQAGMDPETARKTAKATISPMFAEERRAQQLQALGGQSQTVIDDLIEQGVPAARAQAIGMFTMARKLEAGGFAAEATAMRTQASEALQAQELREAELENLKARTAGEVASTKATQVEMQADDDTFLLFNDEGGVDRMESVALTNAERREQLRARGYINVGNAAFGFDIDGDVLAGRVPPSQSVQENIIAGISMLNSLDVLDAVSDQTGVIEGPFRGLAAKFGLAKEGFIDAVAVKDKMKADIQSLIKGIPSNYDAEIFEKLIPDPTKAETTQLYKARVDLLRRETKTMLELIVGFHKGTDKEIPPEVMAAARAVGVDVHDVEGMDEGEFQAATLAHQRVLEAIDFEQRQESPIPDNSSEQPTTREALLKKIADQRAKNK